MADSEGNLKKEFSSRPRRFFPTLPSEVRSSPSAFAGRHAPKRRLKIDPRRSGLSANTTPVVGLSLADSASPLAQSIAAALRRTVGFADGRWHSLVSAALRGAIAAEAETRGNAYVAALFSVVMAYIAMAYMVTSPRFSIQQLWPI